MEEICFFHLKLKKLEEISKKFGNDWISHQNYLAWHLTDKPWPEPMMTRICSHMTYSFTRPQRLKVILGHVDQRIVQAFCPRTTCCEQTKGAWHDVGVCFCLPWMNKGFYHTDVNKMCPTKNVKYAGKNIFRQLEYNGYHSQFYLILHT